MKIFKRIANYIAVKWKYLVGRYVNFLIFPRKIKTFDYDVMTSQETVDMLIKDRLSCSRFGDGEIYLLMGKSMRFQKASASLTERLQEILTNPISGHLTCMTDIFSPTYKKADRKAELYNRDYVVRYEKFIKKNIPNSYLYGNACFTRFYLESREKNEEYFKRYISRIKELWGGEDVYLIEGEFTRCGVENDLLNNASSVHRIICPNTNAWKSYEKIVEAALDLIPLENSVVLCCLGPTATVLAYDLHQRGYRVLDLGHIDIEYEWFKSGTTVMTKIAGKAVNEMFDNSPTEIDLPEEYVRQIIARVL